MNRKKLGITLTSIGTFLAGLFLLLKNPKVASNATAPAETLKPQEPMYKGVPLSELSELAKKMYHGISCSIDEWGFLIFHHKSNRGHQTLHVQMTLDDAGKLKNLGGHYPGQWWSTADEFAKQANELFHFKK